MRFRPPIEAERPVVMLAPMLDIFCLLLIFFLVTSAYSRFETEIDVRVPVAKEGSDPNRAKGEVILNVRRDGSILLEGRVMPPADLVGVLSNIASIHKDVAVILRGDRETYYSNIVKVLDLCRKAGIWNVAFATDRPETAEP